MTVGCRLLTTVINDVLATDSGAEEFRDLVDRRAPSADVVAAVIRHCDLPTAEVAREEFDVLPRTFMSTWLVAWRMADAAGQSFELFSEPAARPLEYARAGRVQYRIENDVDGVRFFVSHVHGHHADWFKQDAVPALAAV
ncbi:MAG: hypothetical protein HOH95_09100 [Dehalococcoidia bacterium]|jgi:hypothetical protein|nr:hypothetical protein [Dehalococcoidia bacterium]